MGSQKAANGDLSFKMWAPNAQAVTAKVMNADGTASRFPMTKNADGTWGTVVAGGFSQMVGKAYTYEVVTSNGQTVDRVDPYARQMQGPQRGIGRTFLDPKTALEVNPFAANARPFMRFEIEGEGDHSEAFVILKDASGHALTKAELLQRLGAFDPKMDPSLQNKLRGGKFNDLWSNNVLDDGRIRLTKEGTAWETLVNSPDQLSGLSYELQVWDTDAQGNRHLLHDPNGDNVFTDAERRAAPDNDPWDNVISAQTGKTFRASVISDNAFDWKNDAAPRVTDHMQWVIEQIHVGSVFGSAENSQRSTFKDVQDRLAYFKSLGVNTLELLPTNQVESNRDWGYLGANSLATNEAYGYEDANGAWVSGTVALKNLIDEAHRQGLNVVNDVVYNHVGGDNDPLWNLDGPTNSFFNWSTDPTKFQGKNTPWGPMPAYNNPHVKQFLVDHAVSQASELHFDGLRFDFTQPIKDPAQGGLAGSNMLREINANVHALNPNFFTTAEQFGNDPAITRSVAAGGAGFDAQWFTEFQHRLVHDNNNPSVVQQAAGGKQTNMDQFMNMLTNPNGLQDWQHAVAIISDHDEVGNAQRTINAADQDAQGIPPQFARNLARMVGGVGLAAPGIPMFFQGDESLAQNKFNWGNPSSWDTGWTWETLGQNWDWNNLIFNDDRRQLYQRLLGLAPDARAADPAFVALSTADKQVVTDLAALSPADRNQAMLDITRKQTFEFFQSAIALRRDVPALQADATVVKRFTNNRDSVMAFSRQKGQDQVMVVGSLNRNNLSNYQIPFPPGQWQEVKNSDAIRYGGNGFGNGGATLNGGHNVPVNIPSGGYLVFRKVG